MFEMAISARLTADTPASRSAVRARAFNAAIFKHCSAHCTFAADCAQRPRAAVNPLWEARPIYQLIYILGPMDMSWWGLWKRHQRALLVMSAADATGCVGCMYVEEG